MTLIGQDLEASVEPQLMNTGRNWTRGNWIEKRKGRWKGKRTGYWKDENYGTQPPATGAKFTPSVGFDTITYNVPTLISANDASKIYTKSKRNTSSFRFQAKNG